MANSENTEDERIEAATVIGYIDQAPQDRKPGLNRSSSTTTYRYFHAFRIETIEDGYNSGRSYHIRADSQNRCDAIVATVNAFSKKARNAAVKANRFQKSQEIVLRFHSNVLFQFIVTSLILLVSYQRFEIVAQNRNLITCRST